MRLLRSLVIFALGAGSVLVTAAALQQPHQQASQPAMQRASQPAMERAGQPAMQQAGQPTMQQVSQPALQAGGQPEVQQDIQFIGNGRNLSNAVRVGNTLYLSGQLGISGERGIQPETRATMERIKSLLEANGATMDDVVKCTVFLADFAEWGAMNEVYAPYFEKHRPARSAVAVSGMAGNARVEIECMAVIGARNASS